MNIVKMCRGCTGSDGRNDGNSYTGGPGHNMLVLFFSCEELSL